MRHIVAEELVGGKIVIRKEKVAINSSHSKYCFGAKLHFPSFLSEKVKNGEAIVKEIELGNMGMNRRNISEQIG